MRTARRAAARVNAVELDRADQCVLKAKAASKRQDDLISAAVPRTVKWKRSATQFSKPLDRMLEHEIIRINATQLLSFSESDLLSVAVLFFNFLIR